MALANAASAAGAFGDLFPPSPRVIYAKAPLRQVIAQLRFPSLLKIDSEPPAEFQERIRDLVPLLDRVQPMIDHLPPELASVVVGLAVPTPRPEFAFRTEDGTASISLSSEHIAFTTTKYTRWEEFSRYIKPALTALLEIYRPSFFQRIGLRYINTIERGALGIPNQNWSELLQPAILGELATPGFEAHATEAKRNIRVALPNDPGCAMFLQHGLAKKKGSNEVVYRLDFDFYRSDKTEVADAKPTLDKLNSMVGRAFRWCIRESLHERLEPTVLELALSN
jgi:uncharacterized protein (TIGR04255 family)